jgi:hypothetical protein
MPDMISKSLPVAHASPSCASLPVVATSETATAGAFDAGGRPRNPSVTAAVLKAVEEVIVKEGFWAPATIAEAIGWGPDVLDRVSKTNRKLRKVRARADAILLAKLSEGATRKALAGDRGLLTMVLRNQFEWAVGAREAGGTRPPSQSKVADLFGLDEAAHG